eukprot:PITA_19884
MAKALWDKLGTLYQSKSLVNKLFLRKKIYNLRMKDGDSVTEHLNAFNTLVSQLSSIDIKISDEDKCINLLCSLPDSWDSLVIAIGSNATALQFDEIVSALLTEEMRRKNMDNQNGDALSVRGRSQNRNKNKSSSGRSKSTRKPTKVVCWKCGKEAHFRRECKSKAPDKGKGSDDAPSAEAKTTSDEGGDVYLASSSTHVDHEAWLIESGASFHFTPHREWFCKDEKYDGGDVFLGDDRKARIIGRGKVKLKLQGGRFRTLPGVLHIPALAKNLISVSKLDDASVNTVFEKDTYKIVRGALVLMWGVRIATLYKLQGSTIVDGCNSSMVSENGAENLVVFGEKTMLWHQRLGHIGKKGLRILHGKGMVEVFDRFKEFKALVENQTEKKIKVLRTNNGGEFCNKEFEEFCKKCGIAWQKTTPYTPQQNGVAERMNKTLMERARSMLSGVGLGQEFWAEAVDTTCYLVNRSPSSVLDDKTPQEVWIGKKPSLSHLRVFGCDAYVHFPNEKQTKLDSKSEKCIFIGYKDGLKGYKLWNPVTWKVVCSRDVVFREVKDVIKHEVQPKEPMKIEFELKEEESDSEAEEESEDEEPQTPAVRRSVQERRKPERYIPFAFCSNFALSITDDDPRTVKEAVDSEDGKLLKEAMV